VTSQGVRPAADKMICQASVPRDVFPPTPPGPEGSNGNGLLRVQWASGAWLKPTATKSCRSKETSQFSRRSLQDVLVWAQTRA
jgi:hypothetical protein